MATHYHSQYDNENFYQEAVYRFNHEFYGRLVLALDRTAVVPLDFCRLFEAVEKSVDREMCRRTRADESRLLALLAEAKALGGRLYEMIRGINERYERLLDEGEEEEAFSLAESYRDLNRQLLAIFRKEQDYLDVYKRQRLKGCRQLSREEKTRQSAYLARKGYSYDTIQRVMEHFATEETEDFYS